MYGYVLECNLIKPLYDPLVKDELLKSYLHVELLIKVLDQGKAVTIPRGYICAYHNNNQITFFEYHIRERVGPSEILKHF